LFKTSILTLRELNQNPGTYALTNIKPTTGTFPTYFFYFIPLKPKTQTPHKHPSNNNNKLKTRLRKKNYIFLASN
jgi:hypothetical protein